MMNIRLIAKVDLAYYERIARAIPAILEGDPRIVIDGGMLQFDTPDEVVAYLKALIALPKTP